MLQRHLTKTLFLALFATLLAYTASAQVTIGASSYTTLKAAFDDINAGVHNGSIAVTISGSTAETASAVLNESGLGSASYTDISIATTGAGPYTIAGTLAAGHLIDLNGADNVTIDGGNILTISNSGTGLSSAIRFINDASNNMLKNTTLLGATSTNGTGVVFFGNALLTGNDNNTVDNCKIANASATLFPINGIMSFNSIAATENNNIIINACDISNYFNAALGTTGININSGNSAWTVTNNKLFQTGTRTFTTAATHHGILVTAGTGYTVSANTIGYSSAAGTGTYTLAGTVSSNFYAIRLTTVPGVNSSIQGNIVTNISQTAGTTASLFSIGILTAGTGNYDIGTVTGNVIGSATGTGAIVTNTSISGFSVQGINSSATGITNISNNKIGGYTLNSTAATIGVVFTGISIGGGTNSITFNTVGSATVANSIVATTVNTAGTQGVVGISVGAIATPTTISDNTIANLTQNGTATGNVCRGISYSSTGKGTIERNNIHHILGATSNTTQAGGGTAVQGIIITGGATTGCLVNANTISAIRCTNTGAVGTTATAIGYSNPNDGVISNNIIYDITNASTSTSLTLPAIASGVMVRAALGTGVTLNNNMITLGDGQTTNTEFVGILNSFTTTAIRAYYNTISIGGTVTTGSLPSSVVSRWQNNGTTTTNNSTALDLRNNIFSNTRTGGTGSHYVYSNNHPNPTVTTIGWPGTASNFNVLNGGATSIAFWGVDRSFADWKTTTGSDNQSLNGVNVPFTNTAVGNLHLNMGTTQSAIESGGTVIAGFTTDIDNETRGIGSANTNGGGTAPDMGADEYDGVPLDLVGPAITIPTLAFSCVTTGRTITATITDFSGVPLTGTLAPRIYFKKGLSGTWYSEAGANTSGSGTNGTWDFTIDHATVGGVVAGDFIYYYVIAQDIAAAGNIGSSPGGAVATDVNTVTTTPNPARYQIGYPTFSGTYSVGAAQPAPFNTLSNAIATFNSACTIPDAVVFELTDPSYSTDEVFPIIINSNPNAGGTVTLTIKPAAGVTSTVSGTTNGIGLIRCFNSFTTIDGSNSGGSDRSLSFINNGSGTPRVIDFSSIGTLAITDCALKNCKIKNGSQNSSAVVLLDASDNAGLFSNITIENNLIEKAYIGVYANGATNPPGNGSGTIMTQNTINTAGTDAIRLIALYAQGIDGGEISFNTIGNFEAANAESDRGIWLATGTTNTRIEGNTITNLACTNTGAFAPIAINCTPGTVGNNTIIRNTIKTISTAGTGTPTGISVTSGTANRVEGNNISDVKNPNTGGWGAVGLNVAATNTLVINNMVSDVAAFGWNGNTTTDNGYGIAINGGSGSEVYHNNVLMNTNQTDITGLPAALLVATAATNVKINNNILVNTQTVGTERYAILSAAANTAFTSLDNNDYFSAGPNLGRIGTINTATIADMQNTANFGGNLNSVAENPVFVSATDLRLNMGLSPTLLESKGMVLASVTDDIDGQTRPGPTGSVNGGGTAPDIGADEFDGVPAQLRLNAKVFLSSYSLALGKMDPYLAANSSGAVANFSFSDPYAAAPFSSRFTHVANPLVATTTGTVLATTGATEVVDWIFVELRTGTPGATIVEYTKVGLLQADGDIVDMDGVSPLIWPNVPFGNYYVVIRHRNNLGFRTENMIPLSSSSPMLNFTNNSVPLFGTAPTFALTPSISVMIGGDANFDGSIDGIDSAVWEGQNGSFDNYADNADYNMDGSIDGIDSALWEVNNGLYEEID